MGQDREDWLDEMITEDLMAMADEREKMLMEMDELKDIDMPIEKLEDIHRELERRTRKTKVSGRIRVRVALAAAAVMVLFIGVGVVSSGSKLYIPVIFQRDRGDEVTSKVNNTEVVASQYDEEEVCQEIEEKLGVLPVRFGYRPNDMEMIDYLLEEDNKEAIIEYQCEEYNLHVYISKEYKRSAISFQTDGKIIDTINIESCGMEVPVYVIDNTQGGEYYCVEFEYLNTYYEINGMLEKEEFLKTIENLALKNA